PRGRLSPRGVGRGSTRACGHRRSHRTGVRGREGLPRRPMEVAMQDAWTEILISSAREVAYRLASIAPPLLAALTPAPAASGAAGRGRWRVRFLQALDLDGRCARQGVTATLARAGIRRPPSEIVGRLVFWIVLVIGLLMVIEALEVPAAAGLAPVVIKFLPSL